jgi:NitT/TauT family transport system substrate-binding protein
MSTQHARPCSRRRFLRGMTLAGSAGLLGLHARRVAAEPPPETTQLRIGQSQAICFAPQYVAAEQLFHAEGFVDVQYVRRRNTTEALVAGEIDFTSFDASSLIVQIDKGFAQGQPAVSLSGLHIGCYELFGTDQIHEKSRWVPHSLLWGGKRGSP